MNDDKNTVEVSRPAKFNPKDQLWEGRKRKDDTAYQSLIPVVKHTGRSIVVSLVPHS